MVWLADIGVLVWGAGAGFRLGVGDDKDRELPAQLAHADAGYVKVSGLMHCTTKLLTGAR